MTDAERKQSVQLILNAIGRVTLMARLSVGSSTIQLAVTNKCFSASWLPAVRHLAIEAGVEWKDEWDFDLFATKDIRDEQHAADVSSKDLAA